MIYAVRPEVCRTCMPGDAECALARSKWGLPMLTSPAFEWKVSSETRALGRDGTLCRNSLGELGKILVVEFVLDRRYRRERLGGERDRLAAATETDDVRAAGSRDSP